MYIKKLFFDEPILYLDKKKNNFNNQSNDYLVTNGKIIYIEENLKSNFFNKFKNEIASSRI